jgi:hypothetical protein
LYDVVQKLIELVDKGQIKVVISEVVKLELTTHKETIVGKRITSYSSHLKNIKHLYELFSEETEHILRNEIQSIQQNLPEMEKVLNKSLDQIIKLANQSTQVQYSEKHKSNVIQRAIDKKFPFHRNKNSIKDALISETFLEFIHQLPEDCERLFFITDNSEDFSDISNKTIPHPDWAQYFNEKIIYSINIATVINNIEPQAIDSEIENEIKERSVNTCVDNGQHHFDNENGFWKNSMYGGGLSWHYRCTKCGITYDTAEYWD